MTGFQRWANLKLETTDTRIEEKKVMDRFLSVWIPKLKTVVISTYTVYLEQQKPLQVERKPYHS
jgi:hypothetical protein